MAPKTIRPLSSYLIYFALAYVGMLILFLIISMFIVSAGSSVAIVAPFLAALVIGEFFVKKENRAPNDAERKTLTLGSFFILVAINMTLLTLAYLAGSFGKLSSDVGRVMGLMLMISGSLALIFGLALLMMRWAYGGLTRKRAEKLLGDQNKTFD